MHLSLSGRSRPDQLPWQWRAFAFAVPSFRPALQPASRPVGRARPSQRVNTEPSVLRSARSVRTSTASPLSSPLSGPDSCRRHAGRQPRRRGSLHKSSVCGSCPIAALRSLIKYVPRLSPSQPQRPGLARDNALRLLHRNFAIALLLYATAKSFHSFDLLAEPDRSTEASRTSRPARRF